MKNISKLKEKLRHFLSSELFASFATLNENRQLHTTLVAFTVTENLSRVYICTGKNTRKFRHLQQFPATSLLVHNCRNNLTNLTTAMAVSINGTARELQNKELEDARTFHLQKHPQMAGFVNSPNSAIFEISVENYNLVTNFQDVTVIEIKQAGAVNE